MSLFVWGLLAAGFSSLPSAATTARTNFDVSASVEASCLISTVTMTLSTAAQPLASRGSMVIVTCTNSTQFSVGFSPGISEVAPAKLEQLEDPSSRALESALSASTLKRKDDANPSGPIASPVIDAGIAQAIKASGASASKHFVVPALSCDTITATVTY